MRILSRRYSSLIGHVQEVHRVARILRTRDVEMLSSDEHSDKQYCVESGLRPIDQIANADEKPSTSWDFYPERRVTQQGGAYTLSLPQSVYSAPILATLNYNGGQCSQLALGVLSGMPCFVSIFLQFTLAVYLHSSLAAASDSCGDAPLLLQRAAVWTFILYVEHDLLETWQMHQWLSQWKTEPHHVKMRLGKSLILKIGTGLFS